MANEENDVANQPAVKPAPAEPLTPDQQTILDQQKIINDLRMSLLEKDEIIQDKEENAAFLGKKVGELEALMAVPNPPAIDPAPAVVLPPVTQMTQRKLSMVEHLEEVENELRRNQEGDLACPEWREALVSVTNAISWLALREKDREAQKVGPHEKHTSSIQ